MKRSRDDEVDKSRSQQKRPIISERSRQSQETDRERIQKLTNNDALEYLRSVRDTFEGKNDLYEEFVEIMKDFKSQRIETPGVVERVKELLKGHKELILGFNNFVPNRYQITLPEEDVPDHGKKPVTIEDAYEFVIKIKTRFQGDSHVYKTFIEILGMFRQNKKSPNDIQQEVAALLHGQQDLLEEFARFMPAYLATTSSPHVHSSREPKSLHDNKSSSETPMRSLHSERKAIASHIEGDVSVDRLGPDHEQGSIGGDKEHRRRGEKEKKRKRDKEQKEQKERHQDGESSHDRQRSTHKCKSARTLEESVTELFHQDMHDQLLCIREKVKQRLTGSDDYQEFLKCILHYRSENITRLQLQTLVKDLLGAYPDLMEEVNKFIDHNERKDVEDGNGDRDRDRDDTDRNLKIRARDKKSAVGIKIVSGTKPAVSKDKKDQEKSIKELDLSNCKRCTPSYRLLPKNYTILSASQKTVIGAEVLNDHWVSVTSGSEDNFKHMRKNQYEETLFRCEDERCQMDILFESLNVTAKSVEVLLNRIDDNSIKSLVHIEDHFTAVNLRCIEYLYGDHALDAIDLLRKDPYAVLPVILFRLKQKQEEWKRVYSYYNKIWAEVYAKNFPRSLDHRGSSFKQQDSKSLNAKALLAEIKAIREEKSEDEKILQHFAVGRRRNIDPHLEFRYSDLDIHEDLYQLMKFSSEQICGSEKFDEVMKIWTTMVEPMFGLPPRSPCITDKEHVSDVEEVNGTVNLEKSIKGDEKALAEHSYYPRKSLGNGDNVVKQDGSPNTPEHETLQINVHSIDGTSGPEETRERGGAEHSSGLCISSPTHGKAALEGKFESVPRAIFSSSEGGGFVKKSVSSSSGAVAEGGRKDGCHNKTDNIETEDSELFLDGDFEDDKPKDTTMSEESDQKRHKEVLIENEADDRKGEENGQKSMFDCENGDGSGNKSADAEDHSHVEHDNEAEREGEGDDAHDIEDDGTFSEHFLESVKPVTIYVPEMLRDEGNHSRVFYGTDAFYIFFRLHQKLYSRLEEAREKSTVHDTWRGSNYRTPNDSYDSFLVLLYNFLEGSIDNATYEDGCLTVLGPWSFTLFTLDKVIEKLSKQLLAIAVGKVENQLIDLHEYENMRKAGKFVDEVYSANARMIVNDLNMYRFECSLIPETENHNRLTIRLMDFEIEHDQSEAPAIEPDPNYEAYLNEFVSVVPEENKKGIFLKRNMKKYATEDEDWAMVHAMEGLQIDNGLAFKIKPSTFLIDYVMGTEDIMVRAGRRKIESPNDDSFKVQKFRNMLNSRVQRMAP